MRKKKYLDKYYEFMRTGMLSHLGLCHCFPENEILELFEPDIDKNWGAFWGMGYEFTSDEYWNTDWATFTPLRQTILLFMAAMNGEL